MSETLTVRMLDEPGPFPRDDRPFRCSRCHHFVTGGKWVSRGIGPGHFVAVCVNEWACRRRRIFGR